LILKYSLTKLKQNYSSVYICFTVTYTMSSIVSNVSNYPLVDKLIENEAEREILLSKPTCFIIIGKPVSFQLA